MQFSPETLQLFAQLLGQVQISPSQPDFDDAYRRIRQARDELGQALKASGPNGQTVEDLDIEGEFVG